MNEIKNMKKYKFNKAADEYLTKFYNSVGAKSAKQKYNALLLKLGYENNVINFSHDIGWESKQGCLEYEILENEGLITMVYC